MSPAERAGDVVMACTVTGLVLATVGVVVACVWLFDRTQVECADGSFASVAGQTCYDYPHAYAGATLLLVSLMFGVLIGLVGVAAKAAVTRPSMAADGGS